MVSPLYTKYARYYLVREVPKIIDFVERVFKQEAGREVKEILNIACGTGGPTIELARRGYRVVGLDASPKCLK